MTTSNQTHLIPAQTQQEGAGVTIHRTIGTPALRHYDPFLLLDHFNSDNPDDYIAGFPSHPHRGFSTLTYMLDGLIEHQDSLGNTGFLEAGSAQLMKAASGIIHSEMPKQQDGLLRGLQLWINLPAVHKMDTPEYQEYPATAFPVIENSDYQLKIIAGTFEQTSSPIIDNITNVSYFDIQLNPTKTFCYKLSADETNHNRLLYLFEGSGVINGNQVSANTLIALENTDDDENIIEFTASTSGARFIFLSGKPINEPVKQYGPFVMNTAEEINQAMQDFQSNRFVREKAWMKRKKLSH